MNRYLSYCITILTLLVSNQLFAQSQTGLIREYYACNYLEGKDLGDLMAARDEAVEMMGDDLVATSFLWTPIRTNGEADFVWFNEWENLNVWGNWMQSHYRDRTTNEMLENFTDMSRCGSGIMHHVPIWGEGPLEGEGPIIVESFGCNFTPEGTLEEVNNAVAHWQQLLTSLGSHDNYLAYMHQPLVNNTGRDLIFYGVFPSFTDYAQANSMLQSSPEFAAVSAHFQSQLRCSNSLWEGQIVVQPQ